MAKAKKTEHKGIVTKPFTIGKKKYKVGDEYITDKEENITILQSKKRIKT